MDEEQLIRAVRTLDPNGVRELMDSFGNRLLRSAVLLCGNETEAQDLVQETFLQAFGSVHRYNGQSSVYTWLHGILLNLTRRYHRSRHRLVCSEELARQDFAAPEISSSQFDAKVAFSALMDALNQLTISHREILVLRFFEEMKVQEIARHLDISQGTVKSRLHYGIAELQKILPSELNVFGGGGTNKRI